MNKFEDLSIQAIVGDLEAIDELKELLTKWTQVHLCRRAHSCFRGCMCPLRCAGTQAGDICTTSSQVAKQLNYDDDDPVQQVCSP